MKHTLSVLVENQFGVLARVAGLFSGRGFNICSLAVGETMDPRVSRMTIVVEDDGSPRIMEQVEKQLNKLVNVLKVQEFQAGESVDRELILVKVKTTGPSRSEILGIAAIFRARVVDVSPTALILELTGTEDKILAFLELLNSYGIKELVRTGKIVIARG